MAKSFTRPGIRERRSAARISRAEPFARPPAGSRSGSDRSRGEGDHQHADEDAHPAGVRWSAPGPPPERTTARRAGGGPVITRPPPTARPTWTDVDVLVTATCGSRRFGFLISPAIDRGRGGGRRPAVRSAAAPLRSAQLLTSPAADRVWAPRGMGGRPAEMGDIGRCVRGHAPARLLS